MSEQVTRLPWDTGVERDFRPCRKRSSQGGGDHDLTITMQVSTHVN